MRIALLIPVGTTVVNQTVEPFVAHRDIKGKVLLSGSFSTFFWGKEESEFGGAILRYSELSRPSRNRTIVNWLGGKRGAETTLAECFSKLKEQPNGEIGPLAADGRANVFYIRDTKNRLRAVSATWRFCYGWWVDAFVNNVLWKVGDRVFSRTP